MVSVLRRLFDKPQEGRAPSIRLAAIFLVCLSIGSTSGCAAVGQALHVSAAPSGAVTLEIGDVVDTSTGDVLTFEDMIGRLSRAPVVFVGEIHNSPEDHAAQLSVLRRLATGGQCIEMGMEMFPRAAQPVLDRYIDGEMTEEQFLKEVHWDQVWGFPYRLYRPLIDFARQNHIRILGLNAPQKVISKIAHEGLASLTPEERTQVARDFHLNDPKNRARILEEYNAHGKHEIKDFESFFAAQLGWEETMAEAIADRLNQTDRQCRIVVILGKGHISDRLGVPYLAAMRMPAEYKTIAPVPINYPFSTFDPDLAEYVMLTDKSEPVHRPRLGVTVRPAGSGKGAEVLGVIPGMPAANAGILKGDVIVSIDGEPVAGADEIQRVLAEDGPDYEIVIQRGKKRVTVEVTIGQ